MIEKINWTDRTNRYICPDGTIHKTQESAEEHVTAKKTDAKKTAEVVNKNRPGRKAGGLTTDIRDLLLEKKHTDETIYEKVSEKYPDRERKTIKQYINIVRWDLNHRRNIETPRLVIGLEGTIVAYTKKEKNKNNKIDKYID